MKIAVASLLLSVTAAAVTAHADAIYQQYDYTSSLTGSMSYLTAGNNAIDPRATYGTADISGIYSISLSYSSAGQLVDYDISMALSNGALFDHISTDSFFTRLSRPAQALQLAIRTVRSRGASRLMAQQRYWISRRVPPR